MPANVYECLFLLDPNKVAGDVPKAAEQIKTILERNKAEILASRPWDERRLAYPIKNHKKGIYYLMYFRAEGKALIDVERDFALTEVILRYLTLKIDRKMVDQMLALARDEHALALQIAPEAGEEGSEEGSRRDRDREGGGGHRGRRELETADKD